METELNIENINFDLPALSSPVIILIGPPGAGKTAVGHFLAQDLHWQFWDTDSIIEKATSMKISDIFSQQGESVFRSLEHTLIKTISLGYMKNNRHKGTSTPPDEPDSRLGTILSCGGGLPLPIDNFAILSQLGTIVTLHAPAEILLERVKNLPCRPLIDQTNICNNNNDLAETNNRHLRLESLIEERKHVYAKAHLTINTGNQTIANVAQRIKEQLALG